MFPLPSVVQLITFRLPVSGVDDDVQDAAGRNSDVGDLECEHDFSFVPARVHMSWKTMFFGSTNGTARRNGEDMVTILIVVDFRSAHSLLSLRTWNVGERLRPTDMMSLFACFDAHPHTIFCRYASFGKQGRTGDNDIEERRRSSLPLQNLYVNQAGFSRHRYARRTFWSTIVYPHIIRFSVSTFQVQQNFSDILLLLLLIFSTGQLSSTPEP